MAKFLMLGKYSQEAAKGISAQRTKKVEALIKKAGGKFDAVYALMGKHDLVLLVDLPGIKEAIKFSVDLDKLTGIRFNTVPAISLKEFDALVG